MADGCRLSVGACKMIRRILDFAHVIDFESIQDVAPRADSEASAFAMAHMLLTHAEKFSCVDDVIDIVPRIVRRACTHGGVTKTAPTADRRAI